MSYRRQQLIEKCKIKLLDIKDKYLRTLSGPMYFQDQVTEFVDMATREQQIHSSSFFRERISTILPEVYAALDRIEKGTFGVCEVTGYEIEESRLLAIPWTKVSMKAIEVA